MKIIFSLGWVQAKSSSRKNFKEEAANTLFQEYTSRISKFSPCAHTGMLKDHFSKNAGAKLWICERSANAKTLSSEEIAKHLGRLLDNNCKELWIGVGGPDGFSEEDLKNLNPDLKWSFGAFTLPHELAAIVASEQIYRAWTILKNLPYHTGH